MAVQNDNTFVTKGDLKSLYADKIAPYLGGGIDYYYMDRTGEEIKCGEYSVSGTLPQAQPQTTTLTISNRIVDSISKRADFTLNNNKIFIPEGMTVNLEAQLYYHPGATNKSVNTVVQFYDFTNSKSLDNTAAPLVNSTGYAIPGAWSTIFTAPEGGAEIGLLCVSSLSQVVVNINESRLLVKEIGRIVDPVKYVSNNSDLEETPVGNIIAYMGNDVPKHYLACNGASYSIGTYPELETWIIKQYGSVNYFGGDGVTTFAVPDLRGEFLRGTGTNGHSNQGSGAAVGAHQDATEYAVQGTSYEGGKDYLSMPHAQDIGAWAGYTNADKTRGTGTNGYISMTGSNANARVVYASPRPTNTSVNYCIKYESTFHAFFSNAAYKVEASFGLNYNSTLQSYVSYSMSYITGDSSLMDGNYFIAPMDGWYMVSFKSNQISYAKPAVQYLQINDVSADAFTDATGSGTSHSNFGVNMTHTVYLSKGDKVNYRVWTNGNTISLPSVRRASFCLITSNYNPTIVSADSVYSENEQMIGYWKNGKPLYQKTVTGNIPTTAGNLDYIDLTSDTTYRLIDSSGHVVLSGGEIVPIQYYEETKQQAIVFQDASWKIRLQYGSLVSNSTYTITVQYTKTTDTASTLQVENSLLLNRPDLWTVGTEYHFGGGLYGIRKTGTITAAADERVWTAIVTNSGGTSITIVNSGGWIKWGDEGTHDYKYSINSTLTGLTGWGSILGAWSTLRTGDSQIALWNASGLARTNAPYDVWVTYRKQ